MTFIEAWRINWEYDRPMCFFFVISSAVCSIGILITGWLLYEALR